MFATRKRPLRGLPLDSALKRFHCFFIIDSGPVPGVGGWEWSGSRLGERGLVVTTYQPATAHSDSMERPDCLRCGTKTRLFGIEPERPGYELRSFECPSCHHIQTAIGEAA